jgi:hypothetical protein
MDMQVSVDKNQDKNKGNQDGRARSLANLRPQRPGEPSRNPSGRPKKDYDLAAMAQAHAKKAVEVLVEVMSDVGATPSARVAAASEILDRGFGSAPKSLDINHTMTISEAFEDFIRSLGHNNRAPVLEATIVDAAE